MLAELFVEGWVTREAVDELSEAYVFLRRVEHRLQMVADEQTQRLPLDPEALETFAQFCGYGSAAAFSEELTLRSEARRKTLRALVRGRADARRRDRQSRFHRRRRRSRYARDAEPPRFPTSRGGDGDDPRLAFWPPLAVQSPRAREVLTELTPALLQAFSGSGDPDAALAAFDAALSRMKARSSCCRSCARTRRCARFSAICSAARRAGASCDRPAACARRGDRPGRVGASADSLDEGAVSARVKSYWRRRPTTRRRSTAPATSPARRHF